MKNAYSGWVLKGPRGNLFPQTFECDKVSCWSESISVVEWRHKNFSTCDDWDSLVKAAKKLGYSVVKAKIVEI